MGSKPIFGDFCLATKVTLRARPQAGVRERNRAQPGF